MHRSSPDPTLDMQHISEGGSQDARCAAMPPASPAETHEPSVLAGCQHVLISDEAGAWCCRLHGMCSLGTAHLPHGASWVHTTWKKKVRAELHWACQHAVLLLAELRQLANGGKRAQWGAAGHGERLWRPREPKQQRAY